MGALDVVALVVPVVPVEVSAVDSVVPAEVSEVASGTMTRTDLRGNTEEVRLLTAGTVAVASSPWF
jgi:hypothetical protein